MPSCSRKKARQCRLGKKLRRAPGDLRRRAVGALSHRTCLEYPGSGEGSSYAGTSDRQTTADPTYAPSPGRFRLIRTEGIFGCRATPDPPRVLRNLSHCCSTKCRRVSPWHSSNNRVLCLHATFRKVPRSMHHRALSVSAVCEAVEPNSQQWVWAES